MLPSVVGEVAPVTSLLPVKVHRTPAAVQLLGVETVVLVPNGTLV